MAVVEAPPARAPRVGLIASSPAAPAGESERWTDDLTYRPESAGPTDGVQALSACPTGDMGDPTARTIGNVKYTPYALVVEDACTTMGGSFAADTDRLRRWMDQRASFGIARELWRGTLAQAESYPNPYLTKASSAADPITLVTAAAGVSVKRALGAVEQALGEWLGGQRGMIHVPRALVPHLTGIDGTAADGILTTKTGNLIVPDAGYPGPGVAGSQPAGTANPAGTVAWIYGTADVVVRQTATFLVPDSDMQAVRTSTNTRIVRAYRLVAAPLDPGRFAAAVDLTAA